MLSALSYRPRPPVVSARLTCLPGSPCAPRTRAGVRQNPARTRARARSRSMNDDEVVPVSVGKSATRADDLVSVFCETRERSRSRPLSDRRVEGRIYAHETGRNGEGNEKSAYQRRNGVHASLQKKRACIARPGTARREGRTASRRVVLECSANLQRVRYPQFASRRY